MSADLSSAHNLGYDLGQALSHPDEKDLGSLVFKVGSLRAPVLGEGASEWGWRGSPSGLRAGLARLPVHVVPHEILVKKGFQFPKVFGDRRQTDGWDLGDTRATSSGPWADALIPQGFPFPICLMRVGPNGPQLRSSGTPASPQ